MSNTFEQISIMALLQNLGQGHKVEMPFPCFPFVEAVQLISFFN